MKIIVAVILIILIIYIFIEPKEHFDQTNKGDIKKIDILQDPFFSNIIVYNNDDNPYYPNQMTGYEKCLRNCKNGTCVEFGVSGTAFCFPPEDKL